MRQVLVLFETGEIRELTACQPASPAQTQKGKFYCRVDKQKYVSTIQQLLAHIQRGDIYEINYCMEFFAEDVVIDPQQVLANLKELTGAPFAGMYALGDEIILCASPERFLQRTGDKLVSQPMKGTAPRGKNETEDAKLKQELATSLKEQTENVMALDVARNDLSVIAQKGTVRTTELFGVHSFKNVHQMVSTAECRLRPGLGLQQIIAATFPPASMTGAPKISACKLIAKYEASLRNIYSGCLGQVDEQGNFDLCVVIRTIIYNPVLKKLSFHVGSAITAAARPEAEWEECLLKADALLKALGITSKDVTFIK